MLNIQIKIPFEVSQLVFSWTFQTDQVSLSMYFILVAVH